MVRKRGIAGVSDLLMLTSLRNGMERNRNNFKCLFDKLINCFFFLLCGINTLDTFFVFDKVGRAEKEY